MKEWSAVAACIAIIAALSACSSPGEDPVPVTAGEDLSSLPTVWHGPVPDCGGPWGAEFGSIYRMTKDRLAHAVLDDCAVTDAEFNSIADDFVRCMDAKRYKVKVIGQDGSFSVDRRPGAKEDDGGPDEELAAAMRACGSGFDAVAGIRGRMLRNPENLNEDEIVVACLIKAGVVDKGYTVKDFQREREEDRYSYDRDSFTVSECIRDPLGLVPAHG
jgi:hypothetical protein